jgi:Fis family transcriptional regulator
MSDAETQAAPVATTIQDKEHGLQDLVYGLVTRFLAENKNKSINDL